MAVITRWSYKGGGRKAGFYCTLTNKWQEREPKPGDISSGLIQKNYPQSLMDRSAVIEDKFPEDGFVRKKQVQRFSMQFL